MKKIIGYILALFTAITYGQSPLVKAEIDTANIRIGEQFEYKISVNQTENVIIPKLDNLKGLEVVDTLKLDTLKNKLIQKYILTGFDSGAFYIPRQQVFVRNQAHLTDSLLVNVATIAVDTTKIKKFPIKGIKSEPYQFDDFKVYVYWIIAILIIVATALYLALKRSTKSDSEQEIISLPPYQQALRSLHLLDEKLLWQNNKLKEYYSELTDIIRTYLEREINIPALEQTTHELIDTLEDFSAAESIIAEKETVRKLEKLLQQSDLVKFAKSKPLAHEIEADRNIAEFIINQLKPAITEEEISPEVIKPVAVVQKPTIEKPKLLVKIVVLVLVIALISLVAIGIVR